LGYILVKIAVVLSQYTRVTDDRQMTDILWQ